MCPRDALRIQPLSGEGNFNSVVVANMSQKRTEPMRNFLPRLAPVHITSSDCSLLQYVRKISNLFEYFDKFEGWNQDMTSYKLSPITRLKRSACTVEK